MADRWEEEAPEDLRDALRAFERDVEDDTMGYERGRPTRHAERSREELKTAILAFARRAESSGREAERADLHPLLFTVQGHLIAWSTVEGMPPLPSALVAALRQIEAIRRPGGTNGR